MRSVLIVGAGPAGLVAAKSLLQHKDGETFKVTIFEAADRVGGMWRAVPGEAGGKCNPEMRTNLSRFIVTFPDLAWQSVPLEKPDFLPPTAPMGSRSGAAPPPFLRTGMQPYASETSLPQALPTAATTGTLRVPNSSSIFSSVAEDRPPLFPKAWEVGRYLDTYANKFVPVGVVQLNRRVTGADLRTQSDQSKKWKVTSVDQQTEEELTDTFDYLVVASGFFDRPVPSIKPSKNPDPVLTTTTHSSQFREVAALGNKRGKIVVVGGGISGTEAAATAAFQISSAKHSPCQKPAWSESIVYHVFDRPFYTLPRFLPLKPYDLTKEIEIRYDLSPHFLPLDLILYDLTHRGKGPIYASNGVASMEKAAKGHGNLRIMTGAEPGVGSDCAEHVYKEQEEIYPAFVSISDTYVEFVRSGLIVPVRGRVFDIVHDSTADSSLVEVTSKGDWSFEERESETRIEDVVGIVEATGFRVNVDYLSDDVKQALNWDPECRRVPLILSRGSIFNPAVPNIAFVGFYEGPFWGVMDMQSRVVAHMWGTGLEPDVGAALYDVSESASVREAIKSQSRHVPQFWMADHVGLVEELSRAIGVQRDDSAFGGQQGPYLSARYQGCGVNEDTTKIVLEVANLFSNPDKIESSSQTYHECISAAAFRGVQGKWDFTRTVHHKSKSAPDTPGEWIWDGKFKGEAQLHPRVASAPGARDAAEYLYEEEGTWNRVDGSTYPGTGDCVFNLDRDVFTIWTANGDGGAGQLFHTPAFTASTDPKRGWLAMVSHRGEDGGYSTIYEFQCKGVKITSWSIVHTVETDDMVYNHKTVYLRPVPTR